MTPFDYLKIYYSPKIKIVRTFTEDINQSILQHVDRIREADGTIEKKRKEKDLKDYGECLFMCGYIDFV